MGVLSTPGVIHLPPNMQALAIPLLLCLASFTNLTTAKTVDDVIAQIIAVNETAVGYASDFSESSFNKVQGIRELEENFFPHEDLVRLAPPSSAETWTPLKILTAASVLVTLVNRN